MPLEGLATNSMAPSSSARNVLAAPSRDSELTITIGRGFVRHDFGGGLQAVHQRHVDVHGDDVGLQRFRQAHGFASVLGVADDVKIIVA